MDMSLKTPVIVLEKKGAEKTLLIGIGLLEAQAIAFALENIEPPRPLTHDLAKLLIEKLNDKGDRVAASDSLNGTFHARILLRRDDVKTIQIDSRPSDAIALALRFDAPILIGGRVLNKVALGTKPIRNEEVEDFKKRLKNLRPEYFTPSHSILVHD